MNKILIALIILNQLLLILYFTYHLTDSDISFNKLKQSNFRIQHIQNQTQEDLSYSESYDEITLQNLDVLYKDDEDILEIIGDDNSSDQFQFITTSLAQILPSQSSSLGYTNIRPQTQLKLLKDPNYCQLHDLYTLTHQIREINVLTDFDIDNPITGAIEKVGKDILPAIPLYSNKNYHIPLETTIYFMANPNFYKYFNIGQEAVCQFQFLNFIPGSEVLTQPSKLNSLIQQSNLNQIPSIILNNKTQCKTYFNNTQEYIDYQMNDKELNLSRLIRKYHDGKLCGYIKDDIILQQPIQKDKFLFIVVLISQSNPLKLYYFDGFYFSKVKGKGKNLTYEEYNATISEELKRQIMVIINLAQPELEQDQRFFQLFRVEFFQVQEQLYIKKITSRIDRDRKNLDYVEKVIGQTLEIQSQLLKEKSLKFRQQFIQF